LKQCLSLSLRSAAALAQLGTHWNTSPQKEVLWWKPPEAWSHPVDLSEPFESYLKARWAQKLPGMLGLQVKYIGWWYAPSRPKDSKVIFNRPTMILMIFFSLLLGLHFFFLLMKCNKSTVLLKF
jgi:hypothetical protein